jgi:hypothetical protein
MNDKNDLGRLAQQVRSQEALGRSATLVRLFDFLVESSVAGRTVKEVEVACAVFGEEKSAEAIQDATVRVNVHRLRKKLEEFYAGRAADHEQRLIIPKGEYRLAVADRQAAEEIAEEPRRVRRRNRVAMMVSGVAIALSTAALVAWLFVPRPTTGDAELANLRLAPFWTAATAPSHQTTIVLGDYYMFGEVGKDGSVVRLVREFPVNSRYDLDEKIMEDPRLGGRYVDLGLRYYPIGVARGLRDILPIMDSGEKARVVSASDLTPGMLRLQNVVYLGYLSGLGPLRNPVFNGSRFQIGSSYDELIDRKTGRTYAGSPDRTDDNQPRMDYAYISRFPGPVNTTVLIIAGTRDAAVMQASDFVTHRANLDAMTQMAGNANAFEALIRVDTLGDQNLGGKLLLASPLDVNRIWKGSTPQRFPGEAARVTPR